MFTAFEIQQQAERVSELETEVSYRKAELGTTTGALERALKTTLNKSRRALGEARYDLSIMQDNPMPSKE